MGGAERIGQFCAEADVSGAVGSSELGLDGLDLGLFCSCVLVRDSEFFTSSNLGLGLASGNAKSVIWHRGCSQVHHFEDSW